MSPNGESVMVPDTHNTPELTLEQNLDTLKNFVAIDLSHEQDQLAVDYAEQKMADRLALDSGRIKKVVMSLWHNYFFREWHADGDKREFREKTQDAENLYKVLGDDPESSRKALKHLVNRLAKGTYHGEVGKKVAEAAGEEVTVIDESTTLELNLRNLIKEAVMRCVNDDADPEAVKREQHDILVQIKHDMPHLFEGGNLLAGNLMELVEAARAIKDHTGSLARAEAVLDAQTIKAVKARSGLSTEVYKTQFSKRAEKLRAGKIFNGGTGTAVIGAAAIAVSTSRLATGTVARALTTTIIGGVVAAGAAGAREAAIVNRESHAANREAAVGGDLTRSHLAEFVATQISRFGATERIAELQAVVGCAEPFEKNDVKSYLDLLAETREAILLGAQKKLELVQYSSRAAVDQERDMLLDLTEQIEKRVVDQFGDELTVPVDNPENPEMAYLEYIDRYRQGYFDEKIEFANRSLNKLRTKRVAKVAAFGVAASQLTGLLGQEAAAAASPKIVGVIDLLQGDAVPADAQHQTLMATAFDAISDNASSTAAEAAAVTTAEIATQQIELGALHITAPEGLSITQSGDVITISGGPENTELTTLKLGAHDAPTKSSIQKLEKLGFKVNVEPIPTDPILVDADQYVVGHKSHFTHVRVVDFQDNGTAVPDGSELQLYKGGTDGSWIDEDGNVVIKVGNGADVISVSASWDHQGSAEVFEVVDGKAVIGSGHVSHDLFTKNGFKGGVIMAANIDSGSIAGGRMDVTSLAAVRGSDTAELMTAGPTSEYNVTITATAEGLAKITDTVAVSETASLPIMPILGVPLYGRAARTSTSPELTLDSDQKPTVEPSIGASMQNSAASTSAPLSTEAQTGPGGAEFADKLAVGTEVRVAAIGQRLRVADIEGDNILFEDINNGTRLTASKSEVGKWIAANVMVVETARQEKAPTTPKDWGAAVYGVEADDDHPITNLSELEPGRVLQIDGPINGTVRYVGEFPNADPQKEPKYRFIEIKGINDGDAISPATPTGRWFAISRSVLQGYIDNREVLPLNTMSAASATNAVSGPAVEVKIDHSEPGPEPDETRLKEARQRMLEREGLPEFVYDRAGRQWRVNIMPNNESYLERTWIDPKTGEEKRASQLIKIKNIKGMLQAGTYWSATPPTKSGRSKRPSKAETSVEVAAEPPSPQPTAAQPVNPTTKPETSSEPENPQSPKPIEASRTDEPEATTVVPPVSSNPTSEADLEAVLGGSLGDDDGRPKKRSKNIRPDNISRSNVNGGGHLRPGKDPVPVRPRGGPDPVRTRGVTRVRTRSR